MNNNISAKTLYFHNFFVNNFLGYFLNDSKSVEFSAFLWPLRIKLDIITTLGNFEAKVLRNGSKRENRF